MSPETMDYHQIVKNIISELTGDKDVCNQVNKSSITEAATYLEHVVSVAMDILENEKESGERERSNSVEKESEKAAS
jgi:hypothetical protein